MFQKGFASAFHYRRHQLGHLRHLGVQRCGVAAGRQHELAVPHRVHHRGAVVALPDPRAVYGRDENRRVKVKHRVEMKFSPPPAAAGALRARTPLSLARHLPTLCGVTLAEGAKKVNSGCRTDTRCFL